MKVDIVHVTRKPEWPLWAVILFFGWISMVGLLMHLSIIINQPVQLCLFKKITGIPCPTCGLTRGFILLFNGNIFTAFFYNPLMFALFFIILLILMIRICFARGFQFEFNKKEKLFLSIFVSIIFVFNWIYIILFVG